MLSVSCDQNDHDDCVKLEEANECTCRCHYQTETIRAGDVGIFEDLFGEDGP